MTERVYLNHCGIDVEIRPIVETQLAPTFEWCNGVSFYFRGDCDCGSLVYGGRKIDAVVLIGGVLCDPEFDVAVFFGWVPNNSLSLNRERYVQLSDGSLWVHVFGLVPTSDKFSHIEYMWLLRKPSVDECGVFNSMFPSCGGFVISV